MYEDESTVMYGNSDRHPVSLGESAKKGVQWQSRGSATVPDPKSVKDKQLTKQAHKHQRNFEQSAAVMKD